MKKLFKFNKEKVKAICLAMMLVCIVLTTNAYATIELDVELSNEYLEWLNDENRNPDDMPRTYGVEAPDTILNGISEEYVGSILENRGSNILKLKTVSASATDSRYNLAEHINIRIKNQMLTSECWAFALISSLESNNLINTGKTDFYSERHMDYATSKSFTDAKNPYAFDREVGTGGLSAIGLAYLTAGKGPVLASDMPFKNEEKKISIKEIDIDPVRKVTDYEILPTIYKTKNADGSLSYYNALGYPYSLEEVEAVRTYIKSAIIKYGAIATVTAGSYAEYYSDPENAGMSGAYFCDKYDITRDHAITIVGWDDNYSRENFNPNHRPQKNGAYIVLNSYGVEAFDKGYMYVSYEDVLIETDMYVIQRSTDIDYDKIYQHDEFGGMFAVGTASQHTGYYGVKYQRDITKEENLKTVGVTVEDYVRVDIYVNPKDGDMSFENLKYVGSSSKVLEPGYHEIDIEDIKLEGDEYAIVVKQVSEDGKFYLTIETSCRGTVYSKVKSSDKSFISFDGKVWYNINEVSASGLEMTNADVCIKGLTDILNEIPEPDPEPDPEPTPDPEPEPEPEPKPEPEPEPDDDEFEEILPDPKPEPKPDPEPTPDPEPDDDEFEEILPDPKPEPDPEPKPEPEPEPDDDKDANIDSDLSVEDEIEEEPKTVLESKIYKIENNKIFKIEYNTSKENFIANLTTDYGITLLNEKDEDVTNNEKEKIIRSGMKLKLENGNVYTLIVRGDTNCDGKITLTDLSKLVLEYNETNGYRLEGVQLDSGDVNCDGKISLTDLSQLLVIYTKIK